MRTRREKGTHPPGISTTSPAHWNEYESETPASTKGLTSSGLSVRSTAKRDVSTSFSGTPMTSHACERVETERHSKVNTSESEGESESESKRERERRTLGHSDHGMKAHTASDACSSKTGRDTFTAAEQSAASGERTAEGGGKGRRERRELGQLCGSRSSCRAR